MGVFGSSAKAAESKELPAVTVQSDSFQRLPKHWMSTPFPTNSMSLETYLSLKPSNILVGNNQYLLTRKGAPTQSWVIRIHSDEKRNLGFFTPGASNSSQFLLVNELGSKVLWQSRYFDDPPSAKDREQIHHLMFPLPLEKGDNFLVFNSRFFNYGANKEFTNVGLVFDSMIGTPAELLERRSQEDASLLFPLGILTCLAVYSLLIFVSRSGKDRERRSTFFLLIFFYFLKEVSSQQALLFFLWIQTH